MPDAEAAEEAGAIRQNVKQKVAAVEEMNLAIAAGATERPRRCGAGYRF